MLRKLSVIGVSLCAGVAAATQAQTANNVALSNIGDFPPGHPGSPVYYLTTGNPASGPDFYVAILGGPVGGVLAPVAGNGPGYPTVFPLYDGLFDGGIGIVPGVPPDGYADFIVRAWHGAATFDSAPERVESARLTNIKLGDNDGLGPPSPSLFPFPSGLVIVPVSEPLPLGLGMLGLLLLIAVRSRR